MVCVELVPDLSQCIESVAKKEYWKAVGEYLSAEQEDKELEEKIELLRMFLESMDFRELRRESERHLVEGKSVKFVIYLEGRELKCEMKVE
jgi:translation initiation factor IF-3